jgi:hypothetical protein
MNAVVGRWNWWLPKGLARLLQVSPTIVAEHPVGIGQPAAVEYR